LITQPQTGPHVHGENKKDELVELIDQARGGDANARGLLLDRYRKYLLLIANEDLESALRSKIGASDLVQQSMMLAQQHFDQFRGNSEPELLAWLRTILVNDLRKSRRQYSTRKRNAGQEVNLQDQSEVGRRLVDEQLTPSSEAIMREEAKFLGKSLRELPESYRIVIELRNFDQLSFAEIGNRMDRSHNAVRQLWARAVESLQASLKSNSLNLTG